MAEFEFVDFGFKETLLASRIEIQFLTATAAECLILNLGIKQIKIDIVS